MSVSAVKNFSFNENPEKTCRLLHPIRIEVKPIAIELKSDENIFCIILRRITCDIATTSCSHKFNREAILKWMNSSKNCPRCNREIKFVTYVEKD